jgi:UDP-glucose:(heptosyl)LPS alpha-1,3-glucosyltransferase
MALERMVYLRPAVSLSSVSGLVARQLDKYFARTDVAVIPNSVDAARFSISERTGTRLAARKHFRLVPSDFVLLLIGNDLKKKGLDCVLAASAGCRELDFKLLVVGSDRRAEYEEMARNLGLRERVLFLNTSPDVMQFYAAADAYVGPSLEDAYGLPILEAMACGLPVIASSRAGVSEIITHRKNGMILNNPEDRAELAELLRELCSDHGFCERLGREAANTAGQQTWESNAAALWDLLNQVATRKRRAAARPESR